MSHRHGPDTLLRSARRRLAGLLGLRAALALVAAVGLAAMAAVLLDAAIVLPETARPSVPWVLAAVGGAVAVAGGLGLARLGPGRVARRLERARPSLGTALTNAVDFERRRGTSAIEEHLRDRAVVYGRERARDVPVWPLVRRATLAAGAVASGAVLLWALGPLLYADVFRAVLPRLLDPAGDHPPYSRLRFAVDPGDTETLYGGQCEVEVAVSGGAVERLSLVTRGAAGRSRSVMFRSPDGTFFQTLTNLRTETTYWVTDGRARSRRFAIAIRKTPQIRTVTVRASYPDYTGWTPRTLEWKEGDFRVPAGTRLEFRATSNRPLARGTLLVTPALGGRERVVNLESQSDPATLVAGGFEVTEASALALEVTDTEGLTSAEPVRCRVTILPDRRPRVTVVEPGRRSLATPEALIPVHVRAEDDFGFGRVLWFRGLNASVERGQPVEVEAAGRLTRVEGRTAFDMKDLGVRPGDRIEFFFEAVDNYPGGPNVGTSPSFAIEVISVEQYRELVRARRAREAAMTQYAALERQMRRIAERAEAVHKRRRELAASGGGTPAERADLRKEMQALRDALRQYRETLKRLLGMPELFAIEEAFRESLTRSNPKLQEAMDQLDQALGLPPGELASPEQLKAIMEAIRHVAGRLRAEVGTPARLLQSVVDLLARAQVFARLAAQQGELVRLLKRFREPADSLSRLQQMELQNLAGSERRVRDALDLLLADLPDLVADLPPGPKYGRLRRSVAGFVGTVETRKIPHDLSEAAEHLTALDGPAGWPPAKRAAENMNALVTRLEGMNLASQCKEACLAFRPAMGVALSRSLLQMLATLQGGGMGGSGTGYYGLLGQSVGLYGPDVHLAGGPAGGRGPVQGGAVARGVEATATPDAENDALPRQEVPERVHLQRDAKFPLRYRTIVGEYFRAVAETLQEE